MFLLTLIDIYRHFTFISELVPLKSQNYETTKNVNFITFRITFLKQQTLILELNKKKTF